MPPYEALYERKCKSPIHWDEMGERKFLSPELIKETNEAAEKIRKRILAAQNRQKRYSSPQRRKLESSIGDNVFP